jgi:hypothetical protein
MTSQWMTRQEAADYLRVSVDTIDRRSVPFDGGKKEGKLRYKCLGFDGLRRVRLLAADVYAVLPQEEAV